MSFLHPERLWLLSLVVLLLLGYAWRRTRRPRYVVRLPGLDLLAGIARRGSGVLVHLPTALLLLSLGTATAAFADPVATVEVPRERATVVVTLDTSLSMAADDVEPDRFAAAKAAAQSFITQLPDGFNVAVVSFSGTATLVVPATQDHTEAAVAVERLQMSSGTAIGEAVAASLDAVASVPGGTEAAPATVVLLSDGANTVGRPVGEAVAEALDADVPVSTIAYGTAEGMVDVRGVDVRVPVDAPALAALAEATGGEAYVAASGDELEGVYDQIRSRVGFTTEEREVGSAVAGVALLASVGALGVALLRQDGLL